MEKPAATKSPRVVFTLRVFAQPAQSRSVECNQIRHAAQLALNQFGGGVGGKQFGKIEIGYDSDLGAQVIAGDFLYEPSAPP
jgi:hypothetical protein